MRGYLAVASLIFCVFLQSAAICGFNSIFSFNPRESRCYEEKEKARGRIADTGFVMACLFGLRIFDDDQEELPLYRGNSGP
jgi:hypothetical protein